MMNANVKMLRKCGVLLPLFSLPSPYGCGGFGPEAFDFVKFLSEAKQSYWQVLPLCPADDTGSPYKSECSFALDSNFISPDFLVREGLLTAKERGAFYSGGDLNSRQNALLSAFGRFKKTAQPQYEVYKSEQDFWLNDYALYSVLKRVHGGAEWNEWPEEFKRRKAAALKSFSQEHVDETEFYKFVQYILDKQWSALRGYAAKCGVKIIGDLPIYAAYGSSDVWANPEQFMLNSNMESEKVAGVPPDDFNEDGQLWGNPVYDFARAAKDGYSFWSKRVKRAGSLYDVLRLDHFRAFESFYAVPADSKNAKKGEWLKGPDIKLFEALQGQIEESGVKIIAEDLGFIGPEVKALLQKTGFPSMKVLQFGLDGDNENEHLPKSYPENCAAYTGTHDNDTLIGFYKSLSGGEKRTARRQINCPPLKNFAVAAVAALLKSSASLAIVPLADYLKLGSEARINRPGAVCKENWSFRLKKTPTRAVCRKMAALAAKYGRV